MKIQAPNSFGKVLFRIVLFSTLIWSAGFAGWWWHRHQLEQRAKNPRFTITKIAAHSLSRDTLPIHILAQLLGIAPDSSLFGMHPHMLAKKLQACPCIQEARVWRLLPGTLGVEYKLRTPVAHIQGMKNIAIDRNGVAFFLYPYFAPKKLPAICVPCVASSLPGLQQVLSTSKDLAIGLHILDVFTPITEKHQVQILTIDMMRARESSIFRKEIVITCQYKRSHISLCIRLLPDNIEEAFPVIEKMLLSDTPYEYIDMRYTDMAIVKKGSHDKPL